jgi:hypothetical protein
MQDRKDNTAAEPSGCKCEVQIADILTRLEKLEREALTAEKIANMPPSRLIDSLAKMPQ